jgi:hypothetical protein
MESELTHHHNQTCLVDCKYRIAAMPYAASVGNAMTVYAESGLISIELITIINREIRLAWQESIVISANNIDRLKTLRIVRAELTAIRSHIIRIDPGAQGNPRRGIFGELCFTEHCQGRAQWLAHDEVMRMSSNAPYRCTDCVDTQSLMQQSAML